MTASPRSRQVRERAQARLTGSQTVPERPPVGEGQCDGAVERAIGLVVGKASTLRAALEERIGAQVPRDAPVLCWLVKFVAYPINRCDVGNDAKSPTEQLRGRRQKTPIVEFGQEIMYMPAKPATGGKWDPRFYLGTFVGEAIVVS